MKIVLIIVGKTVEEWLKKGIQNYVERIGHFAPFEIQVIPDLKNTKNMDTSIQKEREGESIIKLLQRGDDVILLDDKGMEMTSEDMSAWMDKKMSLSVKRLVFIIGGPYGFSKEVYDSANAKLSLSKMTFSHQMVRLIFVEQLYRAFTIINGMPYHHS
jgi:23S rRNA (pseudouridine1915-N3)-methyltransferase